jgi:4-hydroxy-2-oxoheptanedioate aldolase
MVRNRMKSLWTAGQPTFGGWCLTGSPFAAEILASEGFDYVCLDAQHGLLGYETVLNCLYSMSRTEPTPIVRVPSNDSGWIGKVLDAGAQGVSIPMVETPEEAKQAVRNTRIFPEGHRSYGPLRISLDRDPNILNREILCIVMIETIRGVERADEICSVPGVDGVYIGPLDLSISYGLSPALLPQPGPHAEAIETIRKTCESRGVIAGIHCGSGEGAAQMANAGFKMITVSSDSGLLRSGAQAELKRARAPRS